MTARRPCSHPPFSTPLYIGHRKFVTRARKSWSKRNRRKNRRPGSKKSRRLGEARRRVIVPFRRWVVKVHFQLESLRPRAGSCPPRAAEKAPSRHKRGFDLKTAVWDTRVAAVSAKFTPDTTQHCRSGGIGRRAWFRSMYSQGCGGSSPPFGTKYPVLKSTSYSRVFPLCPERAQRHVAAFSLRLLMRCNSQ